MESNSSGPINEPVAPNAEDIVESALKREGIHPERMGLFGGGYLSLLRGRPHLSIGARILFGHPIALLITLMQAVIVYVVTHDFLTYIFWGDNNYIFLQHVNAFIAPLDGKLHVFAMLALAAVVPLLAVNIGWGAIASIVTGKQLRLALLLSAVTGMLPLRLVAQSFMPKWWFIQVEWRLDIALAARILQLSWAYKLATGKSRAEVEMDWAKALDHHAKRLLDGLFSYSIQPIFVLVALGLALILLPIEWPQPPFLTELLDLQPLFAPHFSFIALIAAWLSFERACLAAMVFRFLSASDAPAQERGIALGVATLLGVIGILSVAAIQWVHSIGKELPAPNSGVIWADPALHAAGHEKYGVVGFVAPAAQSGYFLSVVANTQGEPILRVFTRPGESFYYPIPSGEYTTRIYHGNSWKGADHYFGFATKHVETASTVICQNSLLEPMNSHAISGPTTSFCAEHNRPAMGVDDYSRMQTASYLLCASTSTAPADSLTYIPLYLPGADAGKISCDMTIKSMRNPLPFWPVIHAIASLSAQHKEPVGYCLGCQLGTAQPY